RPLRDSVMSERRVTFTREQIADYAKASGDQNPIHLDNDFARSVGLPGVIAHGMLQMGIAATVASEAAGGPGRLRRMSVRFAGMHAQVAVSQGWVQSNATAEAIRQMGRKSLAIKMDETNRDQVREVFKNIKDEFGKIDILINIAATLDHAAQIPNQSYELWDRDVKVNLTGAFNCTKEAWPYMVEN